MRLLSSLLSAGALFALSLLSGQVFGQTAPANDHCATALAVGSTAPVQGTTAGADDNLPGVVGCQAGAPDVARPDVWFSFVATAPSLTYSLAPIGVGAPPLELILLDSGACGGTGTVLSTSCGLGTLSASINGLQPGQPYYVVVASPDSAQTGPFSLQLVNGQPQVTAYQDCNQAEVLNGLTSITQALQFAGNGIVADEVTTINSCFGAQPNQNTAERQSKWYRFVAGSSGTLQFSIQPNMPTDDYDWAVWDVTTDPLGCTTKGNAIACNWTGARGSTGLSQCPTLEPGYMGADQFDNTTTGQTGANAPINLVAGNVYALLVDNYSTTMAGFTLTFGGACPPDSTQPRIRLGLDARFRNNATPASLTVDFTRMAPVSSAAPAVAYHWSFGDGTADTAPDPTHTYARPGTYTVVLEVVDILGGHSTFGRTLQVGRVTGLAATPAVPELTLYPNPASQQVHLAVRGAAASIELLNSVGRVVRVVALPAGQTATDLSLFGLAPGFYTVRAGGAVRQLLIN